MALGTVSVSLSFSRNLFCSARKSNGTGYSLCLSVFLSSFIHYIPLSLGGWGDGERGLVVDP